MCAVINDEWISYDYKEEDESVFILYNHGLYLAEGRIPLDQLLSIYIHIEDRFPSGHEHSLLSEIERIFVNYVQLHKGIYAGRATFKGRRVFYFYIDQCSNEITSLIQRMKMEYPYPIDYGIRHDHEKDFYKHFLLPKEEQREDMSDREVIWTLIENGDALDTPRRVDYWLLFKSTHDLKGFSAWAKYYHFGLESLKRYPQGEKYPYELVIFHQNLPTLENMRQMRNLLKRTASNYNGIYEGWGTQVVHEK